MRRSGFLLCFLLAVLCTAAQATEVTFEIEVPETTPADTALYISGNFESWSGGATANPLYQAQRQADGRYRLTLHVDEGQTLRYKFTLGSWASVERTSDGEDIEDRQLIVQGESMRVETRIAGWSIVNTLAELEQAIQRTMAHHDIPAASVLLMNGPQVLWRSTFGLANKAQKRTATDDTLFRIGSITKMFAAIAALQLQREGKISLTDKLADLAPDFVFNNPWEATHPLRLRHLLEHTSGWNDLHFSEYAHNQSDPVSIAENLALYPATRTSRWAPGTRYAYSNKGATAIAAVVEAVTGMPFETYVEQHVFAPLGMDTAGYFFSEDYQFRGITPYEGHEPKAYLHIMDRAAGSVNASINDMQALLTLYLTRGASAPRVLLAAELDDMESAKTSLAAQSGIVGGYGLANYQSVFNGHVFRGHGGSINNALADLQYSPELGVGYVLMVSAANRGFNELQHLLQSYVTRGADVPKRDTAAVAPSERFAKVAGYYRLSNPRNQAFAFVSDLMSISELRVDEKLRFANLLMRNDSRSFTPIGSNLAVYDQNNLPNMTLVEDPVEGTMLAIGSQVYKPLSVFSVIGTLGGLTGWVALTVVSVLLGVFSLLRPRRWKTLNGPQKWMRLGPLLPLLTLLFSIGLFSQLDIQQIGTANIGSIAVWIGLVAYALQSFVGLGILLSTAFRTEPARYYTLCLAIMLAHAAMTLYLWRYGVIGMRTWA